MPDVVIRGGTIYDGSGGAPFAGDVAIDGDAIGAVGRVDGRGAREIDARGLAVAPGFINMLSWATASLIADGRSQSDIRQGVTLEVMGEGWSMGPYTEAMKKDAQERQGDIKFEITWTTLAEYLTFLERRGICCNVASFVGATTMRIHEVGYDDRPPTAEELARMQALVRDAMWEGALGVGSSLIYAPATYARTDELVALSTAAAELGGGYISHIRSEGDRFLESIDEVAEIAERAKCRAEIYHFKAAGRENWPKYDRAVERVEAARAKGLAITADMYTYDAAATGLDVAMPPWVQEGGHKEWIRRLRDPSTRERVKREMREPPRGWENVLQQAGSAERALLVGFKNEALKPLAGETLAEVARARGTSVEDTVIDLVVEDDSRVGTVYFVISEENLRKGIRLPWMSFGSDAGSLAPEGVFLESSTHPRAYGTFARLLGKYVREEGLIPLEEAVRKLTSLPATNLKLERRGRLAPGYLADFDPATIQDHATFERPHRYATGVAHVFVNGAQVLRDGEHTGATPGRFVRGPGARVRA